MKSKVSPAESTARYKYDQVPATLRYVFSNTPGTIRTSEFASKALIQKGCVMLTSAPDRDVIHGLLALRSLEADEILQKLRN